MNGWFPKINSRGEIVSGNTSIWVTSPEGSYQIVETGGNPQWLEGRVVLYDNRVGRTSTLPPSETAPAYNTLVSNEKGEWAGWLQVGAGQVDHYKGMKLVESIPNAGMPQFGPEGLAYVENVQSDSNRTLIYGGKSVYTGPITAYVLGPPVVVQIATLTYDRKYVTGGILTLGPRFGWPTLSGNWICEQSGLIDGLFVRPIDSFNGYYIKENLLNPDMRLVGGQLLIAASTSNGELVVKSLSLTSPRIDLRTIGVDDHKDPPPPPPPVKMDYLSIIKLVRAKYPTPLGSKHWMFLVDVAQKTDTLLFRKEGGTNVLIPSLGLHVSGDIIGRGSLGNAWADILGDADGAATPTFNLTPGAGGEYVDVSGVTLEDAGDPPPPPPPPDKSLSDRVSFLENLIKVQQLRLDMQDSTIGNTNERVSNLQSEFANKLQAALNNLSIEGSTGTKLGHSHPINLKVKSNA